VILATQVTHAANDSGQLEPMVTTAIATMQAAGVAGRIGTVFADGGYWNSPAIRAVRDQGIDVLIPTRDSRGAAPEPSLLARAPRPSASMPFSPPPTVAPSYRRRQQIVEPVFAHTKVLRRVDRFLRRGLAACNAEWQLVAAAHNLLKLWRAGRVSRLSPGPLPASA
jgi:hypothetical protein